MNAQRRRSARRSSLSLTTTLYALSIALLILALLFFRTQTQGLLWQLLSPLTMARTTIDRGLSVLAQPFISKSALEAQNDALKAELAAAQAEIADHTALVANNAALEATLGLSTSLPTAPEKTLANVFARPPQIPYDTVMLDVGANRGAAAGDIIGRGAVALGTITENSRETSRAVLFSSPGQVTNAFLRGTIPIALTGQGGGSFVGIVPQGTLVTPGDNAILSGVFTAIVATVSHVDVSAANQIFKTVYLSAPVSIFDLPQVEIWQQVLPSEALGTSTLQQKK